MSEVLVTGGSGFLGSHCVLQLLNQGHNVRTTVRTEEKQDELLQLVKAKISNAASRLTFFNTNLTQDGGWDTAMNGCEYVLHVASPFPEKDPENEDELLEPAVKGTLRVLEASRKAGVRRVVLTSSFGAIGYGHQPMTPPVIYDETYWTNQQGRSVTTYIKSKVLAERAAWKFVDEIENRIELSVINPVGIFGPIYTKTLSSSIVLVKGMLQGDMPACPRVYFGVVDVRDVAGLHIRAMQTPEANGQRFLASAGDCISMYDVAQVLRNNLGADGVRAPRRELPDWIVRIAALVKPELKAVLPQLGVRNRITNEKARSVLGWEPRSNEEAIISAAKSLLESGLDVK